MYSVSVAVETGLEMLIILAGHSAMVTPVPLRSWRDLWGVSDLWTESENVVGDTPSFPVFAYFISFLLLYFLFGFELEPLFLSSPLIFCSGSARRKVLMQKTLRCLRRVNTIRLKKRANFCQLKLIAL